jgi:hypothetical protein
MTFAAALRFDAIELRRPVLERDAATQALERRGGGLLAHAHEILSLHL